ncbi:MAG: rhomboid family intramembrane serine protease [Bacillota bacterium]|nr:rhomboid family intramembrane serine protease [Bacillota bacterium]
MYWIDKLERKYGRFSIRGLVRYLVIGISIIFALDVFSNGTVTDLLALDTSRVLRGEVWRLLTFIFVPPIKGVIAIIFLLYLFYMFGTALEKYWGSFRLTLYYVIGVISAIIAAFITGSGTAEFINLSFFLAFAYIYPNFQLLIFFIIPVKVKYLAVFELIFVLFTLLFSPIPEKVAALISFSNFLLFFGGEIYRKWVEPKVKNVIKQQKRKKFKVIVPDKNYKFVHKCRVCGRTSEDHPKLTFAYCSKCGSDYEYCNEHLKNHNH